MERGCCDGESDVDCRILSIPCTPFARGCANRSGRHCRLPDHYPSTTASYVFVPTVSVVCIVALYNWKIIYGERYYALESHCERQRPCREQRRREKVPHPLHVYKQSPDKGTRAEIRAGTDGEVLRKLRREVWLSCQATDVGKMERTEWPFWQQKNAAPVLEMVANLRPVRIILQFGRAYLLDSFIF